MWQNVGNVPKMLGCAKNVGKECKVKNTCGEKMPTQNRSARGRWKKKAIESSQGRAQSWWRPSRVWEARVECRWHGKVAWKSNKDTTPTKWKTSTNEDKWRTTTTTKWTKINKNLQRFSQASTIAGSFWLFYGYWWLFVIYVNNYLWLLWLFYDYLWLFFIIKWLFVIILL